MIKMKKNGHFVFEDKNYSEFYEKHKDLLTKIYKNYSDNDVEFEECIEIILEKLIMDKDLSSKEGINFLVEAQHIDLKEIVEALSFIQEIVDNVSSLEVIRMNMYTLYHDLQPIDIRIRNIKSYDCIEYQSYKLRCSNNDGKMVTFEHSTDGLVKFNHDEFEQRRNYCESQALFDGFNLSSIRIDFTIEFISNSLL